MGIDFFFYMAAPIGFMLLTVTIALVLGDDD